MVEFNESSRWTLVNGHTIHTDYPLHDRPMMLTSVPKRIELEISSFEVVRVVDWPDRTDSSQQPGSHVERSYLKASASLLDRIVVFDMANGEIATFREISDVTIRPVLPGSIGGKHAATSFDGIGFSGMSSQTVPEGGLMIGEPGRLHYLPHHQDERRGPDPAHLSLTVHVHEDRLAPLLAEIAAHPDEVRLIRLHVLIELFESETSASLSEPWMSREYGLLLQNEWSASTAARLETLSVVIGRRDLRGVDTEAEVQSTIPGEDPSMANLPALIRLTRLNLGVIVLIAVAIFYSLLRVG